MNTLIKVSVLAIFFVFQGAVEVSAAAIITPGVNLQALIDANPPGTIFEVQPGTYRLFSVQPKTGDSFVGQGGPVLSGASLLTAFTYAKGVWSASGQTQQGYVSGYCASGHPMCAYPEDLFFDSVPLKHVASLAQLVTGTWYFDYSAHVIYFADSPQGHTVETSVSPSAFSGPATDVTISGFIIEKYAVPSQMGAVGGSGHGSRWIVSNNEIRLNHAGGVNILSGDVVNANFVHNNGQKGLGGIGTNLLILNNMLISNNEVSFNNWAGYDCGWECGGMKFAIAMGVIIRGNYVHDNYGPGIWLDVDNINAVIDANATVNNTGGPGIFYEISDAATISNNYACGNTSPGATTWLWNSQIMLSTSQNVNVFANRVETGVASFSPQGLQSNGIGVVQQNRGTGTYGVRTGGNNSVHNNDVIMRGTSTSGAAGDYNEPQMLASNSFDYNSYHVVDPVSGYHWKWGPGGGMFAGFQEIGQELNGTVDGTMPTGVCSGLTLTPLSLSPLWRASH